MDPYYNRTEVSNSDLSALKNYLEGIDNNFPNRDQIFYFGNLFDAMLTEPHKIDFRNKKFDGVPVDSSMFYKAEKMKLAFLKDPFALHVFKNSKPQSVIVDKVDLTFHDYPFSLMMRCKFDFDLSNLDLVVDLKSTSSTTQEQFDSAILKFDYDRQAAVYMTMANVNRFAIIGVSKKNQKLFKVMIDKNSDLYKSGMEKFTDLAFKWWSLFC